MTIIHVGVIIIAVRVVQTGHVMLQQPPQLLSTTTKTSTTPNTTPAITIVSPAQGSA